jgi:hypothetical protein
VATSASRRQKEPKTASHTFLRPCRHGAHEGFWLPEACWPGVLSDTRRKTATRIDDRFPLVPFECFRGSLCNVLMPPFIPSPSLQASQERRWAVAACICCALLCRGVGASRLARPPCLGLFARSGAARRALLCGMDDQQLLSNCCLCLEPARLHAA